MPDNETSELPLVDKDPDLPAFMWGAWGNIKKSFNWFPEDEIPPDLEDDEPVLLEINPVLGKSIVRRTYFDEEETDNEDCGQRAGAPQPHGVLRWLMVNSTAISRPPCTRTR